MAELSMGNQRLAALISVYVLAMLSGAWVGFASGHAGARLDPDGVAGTYTLIAILMSLDFTWFCTVDGELLGRPLTWPARIGIFLGWPVGVPIYLLWARGISGFAHLLVYGVSFLLAVAISMINGAVLDFLYFGR